MECSFLLHGCDALLLCSNLECVLCGVDVEGASAGAAALALADTPPPTRLPAAPLARGQGEGDRGHLGGGGDRHDEMVQCTMV